MSSIVLNFGMVAHSTILISQLAVFQNRQLWTAEIIFTLVFLIFLEGLWFFLNCSLLTYIIFSFPLQSYKSTELQPL